MATPGSGRTVRSPTFPSFDRKDLWVERTKNLALNDIQRSVVQGEINAMSDEEVTAALVSIQAKQEEV
jgi:propanediol dehydratase small subunit